MENNIFKKFLPKSAEAQIEVFKSHLDTFTNAAAAQAEYEAVDLSEEQEKLLLNKWNELSMAEVAQAHTSSELYEASKNAPADSPAERLAVSKFIVQFQKEIEDKKTAGKSNEVKTGSSSKKASFHSN